MDTRVTPAEHPEYIWIKETEADGLLVASAVHNVLYDTFKFSKNKAVF